MLISLILVRKNRVKRLIFSKLVYLIEKTIQSTIKLFYKESSN